ncbi:pentatricopeptide repeat-containing protein At1g62350 [Rhodamnia argentea]|uniref:Pentatricopeptide repeat-containing protein At1g62350 n=1 Tax=Rhodamnia argentea TaxID=178133 RepID=A0A8B8NES0_9MYRT|nr:pentatricopeptide repeat-containing protein At1g62350 [Rhodamnia argentea]XP_030520952.1 pentatricopeptide repeat-containing protein At1g62350 [Rhodamnia argentea]XP_030520953.1 pentatricopeptide repeat-containing protein At1g62350 [Rhodamnia argentea]XP_030520955.1 pentatricopeptide repeat-containing protein At1g62350 [Rhodamnia argentea]XP_030520958.1 pentatricopeptide repeat-containing protein At1g62350 [Rhodamnia argentea]XP_030520959.1 pentatricopeptide repeat-containing protein At1g62
MLNLASHLLLRRRTALRNQHLLFHSNLSKHCLLPFLLLSPRTQQILHYVRTASSPSLSIWRRKKEIGKEGLIVAKELKRLQTNLVRLDRFIKSHVSRLLKSDLVSVLAEFQRQDQVFLCMKLYNVVRKEIWYRPDMFFYRDMLMMLARNKNVDEASRVWEDLKREEVLFDQHTFGDIVRAFLDSGLPSEAMEIYGEMRQSPDPPLSLPFRVILKGLIPYPELRERVKDDFLELFPGMIVYDPPEDLFEDQELIKESEDD